MPDQRLVEFKFELGSVLKDTVTEFEGTAVTRVEYLNGCIAYSLKGKVDKDGKVPEGEWVDEDQLVMITMAPDLEAVPDTARTGGGVRERPPE